MTCPWLGSIALLVCLSFFPSAARAQEHAAHDAALTRCVDLAPGEDIPGHGCWNLAFAESLSLADGVHWRLFAFDDRAAAEAARSEGGLVVEVDGRVWLSEVGPVDAMVPGEPVATAGPFDLPEADAYGVVLSYAVMPPGARSVVHTHAGPEAWHVLAGEQCLETPAGATRARAGETMAVAAGLPMELTVTGSEIRRSLLVVIHDASRPRSTPSDWQPSGACGR